MLAVMDTKRRSITKGITWRALAMTDTVLLAFIFTGSLTAALSIGGIELITKVIWYYFHERLWLHIPAEHEDFPRLSKWLGHERKTRSFIKAVSWRFFGAIDTTVISFVITGHLGVSGAIGGTELITKILLYYLHDRAWSHVQWGKRAAPAVSPHDAPSASVLKDLFDYLRRQYHIGAVVVYAVACILFVLTSATIVYGIHSALGEYSVR